VGEAAAAARALKGVDLEAAANQLGPRGVGAKRRGSSGWGGVLGSAGRGVLVVVAAEGGDGPAPAVVGGPNAGVEDLVRARPAHEGREAGEELDGAEPEVGRAIRPRRSAANPAKPPARSGAGADAVLDAGGEEVGHGLVLGVFGGLTSVAVVFPEAAADEQSLHGGGDLLHQAVELVSLGTGQAVEGEAPGPVDGEDPVRAHRVEVEVELAAAPEPLEHGDGAALASPDPEQPAGLVSLESPERALRVARERPVPRLALGQEGLEVVPDHGVKRRALGLPREVGPPMGRSNRTDVAPVGRPSHHPGSARPGPAGFCRDLVARSGLAVACRRRSAGSRRGGPSSRCPTWGRTLRGPCRSVEVATRSRRPSWIGSTLRVAQPSVAGAAAGRAR
jgi:hypothetical protein